ncbi:MAG: single-stranded DNA-binding protein [Campylobacterales bacterium]|nr:single-stranded DNA-binding protein [Campylobacterales bacterium]
MFNKVVLVGNLTRDIELRYAQSGSAIANTAIATSRKFTQNGERKEEVCFIDITFFGRSAEVANQYLRRGSKILVEGRLNFDQWVAQDGSKRSKHSVIVETMQMLDSKADAAQGGGYDAPAQQNSQGGASTHSQQSYAQPKQQQAYGQQNSYGNAQQQQPQSQQRQEMPQHNIPVIDIDEDEIPF